MPSLGRTQPAKMHNARKVAGVISFSKGHCSRLAAIVQAKNQPSLLKSETKIHGVSFEAV